MQSPQGLRRAARRETVTPPISREPEEAYEQAHEPAEDDPAAHIHLPPPTIWPVTVAAGVALAGFGLVTTTGVSIAGVLVMIWGIFEWVQELRHEHH